MSDLKFEVPEGGFQRGDIVHSKHHGPGGVWGSGGRVLFPELNGGSTFIYAADGRYFTDGAFEDKECMLALVERKGKEV